MKINIIVFFAESHTNPGINDKYESRNVPWKGDNQPPKNIMLDKILMRIRFIYSARKNIANAIPEYST